MGMSLSTFNTSYATARASEGISGYGLRGRMATMPHVLSGTYLCFHGRQAGALAVTGVSQALLSVRDVTVKFGGITALDAVGFDVKQGSICGLIGPNGAGKTTLFNCMSRLYNYQSGDILFEGSSITATPTHKVAGLGMGRTFQNLAMFQSMPVRENVMVGAHARSHCGFASSALRLPRVRAEERRLQARAAEIMDYLDLTQFSHRPVGGLPFGIQKRVEFARGDRPHGGQPDREPESQRCRHILQRDHAKICRAGDQKSG